MSKTKQKKGRMFIGTLERFSEKYQDIQVKIIEKEPVDEKQGTFCILFTVVPFEYVENNTLKRDLASEAIKYTMLFS